MEIQKALYTADKNNLTRFVSMQNHMNLIYRGEEREMLPLCKSEKIAVTPYSPMAVGRLTRDLGVTAPVIGATKISHIEDVIASLDVKLDTEDMTYLR